MLTQTRTDIAALVPGPVGAAARLPGRDHRPADRSGRRARRRAVALRRRPRERDRFRRGRPPRRSARSRRSSRTGPSTSSPTPRARTTTTPGGGHSRRQETQLRLSQGRVCFNWYRIGVTIPDRIGEFDPTGASVVFEVVIDDYAEVWVNGELPHALGDTGGHVAGGFNAPNRVLLTDDARPGQHFQIAVFGINGPISASPHNYIWMRTATLDFYAAERARTTRAAELEVERADPDARLDPRARRHARASRRRVRVHRGSGLEPGRRPAVQLAEHERDLPLASGRPRVGVPLQERLQRRRHRPLHPTRVKRAHVRPRGTPDDLPARQPARDPGRAARQHHRPRRPVRRSPAEQSERPRLPLRRDAVLHRPSVRAARRVRRSRQGASVQRRVRRARRRRDGSSPTSSRGRTGSRSHPTSATCTSATGTPSARS